MEKIVLHAYAKVNLGLDVLRRRENGYHDVKMVMQTVGLHDVLTIEKAASGITLTVEGSDLPGDKDNLIYKAANLMQEKYHIGQGMKIHLRKNIPIAAGMAGGSTDAAAAFKGINSLFDLGVSEEELRELAVTLGADIPYCIIGSTALSEGIGEVLTPLPGCLNHIVLIAKPPIAVSTKFVYENLHVEQLQNHPDIDGMVQAIENRDSAGMIARMENVLETVTIREYPVIGDIKQHMLEHGAIRALMSGSGPTVFGLFEDRESAKKAEEQLRKTGMVNQIYVTEFVQPGKEESYAG